MIYLFRGIGWAYLILAVIIFNIVTTLLYFNFENSIGLMEYKLNEVGSAPYGLTILLILEIVSSIMFTLIYTILYFHAR